jgi:predicted  nucleic acid-binding Zn-ribbon protein
LKKQLLLLVELQKVESEIGITNIKCRTLPEKIAELDEAFNLFQNAVEEKRKIYDDIQKGHREKEEKLKKGQEALKKAKERLGEVKTNKEYQAVLKEIEGIESKNSETEDEIISLLEKIDHIKTDLGIKDKEGKSYGLRYAEEKNKLEGELNSLDAALSECRKRGDELKKRITGDFLKKYEAIKSLHNGLAVVPVWKEICEGCHMKIPAQLYNEVQKFIELCLCPNCSRIIYWYDRDEEKN